MNESGWGRGRPSFALIDSCSLPGKLEQTLQTQSRQNPREAHKLFNVVVIGSFPSAEMVSIQLSHLISQQLALDRMFFFHSHLSGRKLRPMEDSACIGMQQRWGLNRAF